MPIRALLIFLVILSIFWCGCANAPFTNHNDSLPAAKSIVPSDTLFSHDQWYLSVIQAPKAWSLLRERQLLPTVVAVLDNEPSTLHEDLRGVFTSDGRYFANYSTRPINFAFSRKTRIDHANHVIGLLAALSDNGLGIAGVAYNRAGAMHAKIMPVGILNNGIGTVLDLLVGILYGTGLANGRNVRPDQKARIINMSLGVRNLKNSERALLEAVVRAAEQRNILIIAAVGNNGMFNGVEYPAAFDTVVAVGAVYKNLKRAVFSAYGSAVDIVAPGDTSVQSGFDKEAPYYQSDGIISTVDSGSYRRLKGTSMAVPLVSGTAAMILSVAPGLTAKQVRNILYATARDLGDGGKDIEYGHGLLNAEKAVAAALVTAPYKKHSTASQEEALSWTFSAIMQRLAVREQSYTRDLVVLFEPMVVQSWNGSRVYLQALAEQAGIEWVFSDPRSWLQHARVMHGHDAQRAGAILNSNHAVLLVTQNRAIVQSADGGLYIDYSTD